MVLKETHRIKDFSRSIANQQEHNLASPPRPSCSRHLKEDITRRVIGAGGTFECLAAVVEVSVVVVVVVVITIVKEAVAGPREVPAPLANPS